MADFASKHCKPCEGGMPPLSPEKIQEFLKNLTGWQLDQAGISISKHWRFKGFSSLMFFINGVAFLANQEQHHPDVTFSYNTCTIKLTTHAINGLSENDFIVAAKIEKLLLL